MDIVRPDNGRKRTETPLTKQREDDMNTTTTPVADTTPVAVVELSKSAKSDAIYAEELLKGEEGLRARCLARFETELGLKKTGGGSTYFQNCKTRAKGEKVKHSYTPKSKDPKSVDTVDDSKEDADLFPVAMADGTEQHFTSQEKADEFKAANAGKIAA